jgi:hypothetical protein
MRLAKLFKAGTVRYTVMYDAKHAKHRTESKHAGGRQKPRNWYKALRTERKRQRRARARHRFG